MTIKLADQWLGLDVERRFGDKMTCVQSHTWRLHRAWPWRNFLNDLWSRFTTRWSASFYATFTSRSSKFARRAQTRGIGAITDPLFIKLDIFIFNQPLCSEEKDWLQREQWSFWVNTGKFQFRVQTLEHLTIPCCFQFFANICGMLCAGFCGNLVVNCALWQLRWPMRRLCTEMLFLLACLLRAFFWTCVPKDFFLGIGHLLSCQDLFEPCKFVHRFAKHWTHDLIQPGSTSPSPLSIHLKPASDPPFECFLNFVPSQRVLWITIRRCRQFYCMCSFWCEIFFFKRRGAIGRPQIHLWRVHLAWAQLGNICTKHTFLEPAAIGCPGGDSVTDLDVGWH